MCAARVDPLQLLTVEECSEYLRLHPKTVRREIAAGRLKSVRLGTARRVPQVALAEYIEGAAKANGSPEVEPTPSP